MGKSKVNLYTISTSPNQHERAISNLKKLGLTGFYLESSVEKTIKNSGTYYDFLEDFLEKEMDLKEDSRRQRWIKQAGFPWIKTIEDFDFDYQPDIDKKRIMELASGRFIKKTENIFFFGQPGVGKTHLAIALGIEAINRGFEVRFLTLERLIEMTRKSSVNNGERFRRIFSSLAKPELLILDEIDSYDIDNETSVFLTKLLYARYEKGSIVFTSNSPFSEWEKLFRNKNTAGKIIDRITHHHVLLNINGQSYRMKDKIKGENS